MFRIQGSDEQTTRQTADRLVQRAQALQRQFDAYQRDLLVLGPAPAPLFKLRNKFSYLVLIKCD